ncbi:hypothetical protein AKJ51_03130, partial [candidate division MSBL1 archaeon SCGC-AAA382A20]
REKNNRYSRIFQNGPVALRTRNIGIISKENAEKDATGPIARASGMKFDYREPHSTYQKLDFSTIYREEGDVLARVVQRFDEVNQSIDIIKRVIDRIEPGPIREYTEMEAGEAEHRMEAPRGELTYYIRTNEEGNIEDATIRTPSIMNVQACVDHMMGGAPTIADAVAIYESVDPCIACLER